MKAAKSSLLFSKRTACNSNDKVIWRTGILLQILHAQCSVIDLYVDKNELSSRLFSSASTVQLNQSMNYADTNTTNNTIFQ